MKITWILIHFFPMWIRIRIKVKLILNTGICTVLRHIYTLYFYSAETYLYMVFLQRWGNIYVLYFYSAERLKAYAEKKSKKPALIAKTSVLFDVKVIIH